MEHKHRIPMVLPSFPQALREPSGALEGFAAILSLVFFGIATAAYLKSEMITAGVFAALGALGVLFIIVTFIQFKLGSRKNKENFFDPIRAAVKENAGLKLSDTQIARMWLEGSATDKRGNRFRAESRKGKEFTIGIY